MCKVPEYDFGNTFDYNIRIFFLESTLTMTHVPSVHVDSLSCVEPPMHTHRLAYPPR